MIDYKTLENTSIETLHEAFVNAFSDYQVKIDLPLWKLQQMLKRRGYAAEISMGAFVGDKLVGFVLNGFRDWNGESTVYDTGTGVIGEYRKQGITSSMLSNIRALLNEKCVEQYLLEVIQTNTNAVNLYKKQGFEVVRDFACFILDKSKYKPVKTYTVEHVDRFSAADWEQYKSFWDFYPSWQNSIDSIKTMPDNFIYSVVRIDNNAAGYGIIEKKTGDIPQIAVNKEYRHKGIAGSILADLIENTDSQRICCLNVDDTSKDTKDFLLKSGFNNYISQYEMVLKL